MIDTISRIGRTATGVSEQLGSLASFAAAILLVTLRPPLRMGEFWRELYKAGVLSLLIICVSGVAVGMVLSLQGYTTLVRFGAENSLGAVVGISLTREFGPVLTALLATGCAGSSVTAEIGTMKATEQIDGLRMMAIDPIDYVVRPRAWALAVAMPLLSALFIVSAMGGGYFVGVRLMGMDGGTFMSSMENAVDFENDIAGSLLKAAVFGVIVALISTYRGYTAAPTSSGVSSATTSTVVLGSVTVLVFDYFLTALWGV